MRSRDVGPTSPQLAAAVSAQCAGLEEKAAKHFEEAVRIADTLPDRLAQPAARMWYGRFLASGPDECSRGLALLRQAAADFALLGMPLHRGRAEEWLAKFEYQ